MFYHVNVTEMFYYTHDSYKYQLLNCEIKNSLFASAIIVFRLDKYAHGLYMPEFGHFKIVFFFHTTNDG